MADTSAPANDTMAELGGAWVNSDDDTADIMVLDEDGSLHWLAVHALQGQRWQADDDMLTLHSIARHSGDAVARVFTFHLSGDQLVLTAPFPADTTDGLAESAPEQRWQRRPDAAASVAGEVRLPDGHSPPPQAILALSLEKQSSESAVDGAIQRRVSLVAEDSTISYRLYYDPAALDDGDILHIQASIIADGTRYYSTRRAVPSSTQAGAALMLELSPMGPGHSNGATTQ